MAGICTPGDRIYNLYTTLTYQCLKEDIMSNQPVWRSDQGDGTYINPILHLDYSDPDVIRVGDDFFMTASSFNCTPGLPILHSKDLVNWRLVNYAFKNLDLPGYDRPMHGCGIWAPSIRYHNGLFWICVGLPDEGIYMTTAEDPFDEWSPLFCIKPGKGWIDPCPFWDDDGQAYLVHALANSRCGIKSKLILHRMAPDGTGVLNEGKIIFDGTVDHPTVEGPKMYKRNGYYYIMAPAGGVTNGWQTVLRSQSIWGPYEDRIVLRQGSTPVNGPHQGGYIELESGEGWFMHFQDRSAYGRIVHLQPVYWVDDWPVMGDNGEPVLRHIRPNVGRDYPIETIPASDSFDQGKLGLQWQWFANHKDDWYSLGEYGLRLYTQALSGSLKTMWAVPNILAQKLPGPEFTATVKLTFEPQLASERAGLVITGDKYSYLALAKTDSGWRLERWLGNKDQEQDELASAVELDANRVYLRVEVEEQAVCTFSYSLDGEHFQVLGSKFQAVKGRWIGSKIGLFSFDPGSDQVLGYADFAWVKVEGGAVGGADLV